STAEDVKHEEQPTEDVPEEQPPTPKFVPSAFHETCVARVQQALHRSLVKRTRVSYTSADGAPGLIGPVSRMYTRWEPRLFLFAVPPHQQEFFAQTQGSFFAFGCGTAETVLLIPFGEFAPWLKEMNITEREDRFYWHVHIFQ